MLHWSGVSCIVISLRQQWNVNPFALAGTNIVTLSNTDTFANTYTYTHSIDGRVIFSEYSTYF
jgi:hypothetical protein